MSVSSTHDPVKRVLVVAYYFPPMGMSGVQRTVKLLKYLPEYGWTPTVLTAQAAGYFAFDPDLEREVESMNVAVHRTASVDPTRLFGRRRVRMPDEGRRSLLSRTSQWIFVPDNKIGWLPAALSTGRRLLRDTEFDAILSTAPPYTGHLVAARLARESGAGLVLDFRDDWVGNPRHVYPTRWHRSRHERLERRVMRAAGAVTAINPTIADALCARNPDAPRPRVLTQGFDPDDYPAQADRPERFTLIYTGVFYDAQRPEPFLEGLAKAMEIRPEMRAHTRARFLGLFPESARDRVPALGLESVVDIGPYVTHRQAMSEVAGASVAWLIVGRREGADQISTGKLYAYFGARVPVLAIAPEGEVRREIARYGAGRCADPGSIPEIASAIEGLYDEWLDGRLPRPTDAAVAPYDRRSLAGQMARTLDDVRRGRDRDTGAS